MNLPDFKDWLKWWGEEKLTERINKSQGYGREKWAHQDEDSICQYPAWELIPGFHWRESVTDWHARWIASGGKLYEGRMIAGKRDAVWELLGKTFSDGFPNPYPPFARSSCMTWRAIERKECVACGIPVPTLDP